MSKKNRSEKEMARLRREIEFLKTQVKSEQGESSGFNFVVPTNRSAEKVGTPIKIPNLKPRLIEIDYSYLKRDLLRTAILAALAFSSIFSVYFYQRGKIF